MLKAPTSIISLFKFKNKAANISAKIKTKNSAKSGIFHISADVIKIKITVSFKRNLITKVDNKDFSLLEANVSARSEADNNISIKGVKLNGIVIRSVSMATIRIARVSVGK